MKNKDTAKGSGENSIISARVELTQPRAVTERERERDRDQRRRVYTAHNIDDHMRTEERKTFGPMSFGVVGAAG